MLQTHQLQNMEHDVYSKGGNNLNQEHRFCDVHDFSEDIPITHPEEFNCVKTKMNPPVDICVYPDKMDKWTSRLINNTGWW